MYCLISIIYRNNEILFKRTIVANYSVFQGFGQAKFDNGDSILSSSQFLILPQLLFKKMELASKVV
jgi:hypothetical protein